MEPCAHRWDLSRFLPWAMRNRQSEAGPDDARLECKQCRTLAAAGNPYCGACGGDLGPRKQSRVAYDAIAVFVGVIAVILYWFGRNS